MAPSAGMREAAAGSPTRVRNGTTTSCVNAGLTYAQLRFSHAVGYGFARRLLFRTVEPRSPARR
jgi:hypothetical protein